MECRHQTGVAQILFATDLPHIECEWPDTKPIVEEIYANVPEDKKLKIWAGNTVKFFNLENAHSKVKTAEVTA